MNKNTLKVLIALSSIFTVLLAGCTDSKKPIDSTDKEDKPAWVTDPGLYVDPFIGTSGGDNFREAGNTVPGAVMPAGMLSFGPEVTFTEEMLKNERFDKIVKQKKLRVPVSAGGYNWDAQRIKGFSLTRLSGTGCLGASGDIPFLPFTGDITSSPDSDYLDSYYSASFSHDDEIARPGYYQVGLGNGVNVELAATNRTGIARFVYPKNETARLLVRTSYSQLGSGDAYTKVDIEKGEISGYVTSGNFCGYLGEFNRRDYYTLYFVAKFDNKITASGGWQDDKLLVKANEVTGGMPYGEEGIPPLGKGSGMWIDLDTEQDNEVNMKVAISYVSIDNARLNLAAEQTAEDTLDTVKEKSYAAWNDVLSKVRVVSSDTEQLTTFYTALYHTQFHPNIFSDVNGEYAGFDQKPHQIKGKQKAQYANFSGWDVYRSQLQLVSMIDSQRGSDIAQSLFNQSEQYNGVWDRWTHNNGPTGVMSGDPSTIAIANFVAFGSDDFDVNAAYQSLTKAARTPTTLDLSNEGCPIFCRGQKPSLDQWLSFNYISDKSNSWEGASETLEQVSADFALSQLAEKLDKPVDHNEFLTRSGYWRNLYNENATDSEGYVQGRLPDGSWKPDFDPASEHLLVEGSSRQYTWMIPFDGKGLLEQMGGVTKAATRLDNFFKDPEGEWTLQRSGGGSADVSNQPSINSPFMYLFTDEPHKTPLTVRKTMKQLWHSRVDGIPGQDDLGQMSSWYVFSALGLYPLYPGNADMVLSSPSFSQAEIQLDSGIIRINAPDASAENVYVTNLHINGGQTFNSWIDRNWVDAGITLDFELNKSPNMQWGIGKENQPPSYSLPVHLKK